MFESMCAGVTGRMHTESKKINWSQKNNKFVSPSTAFYLLRFLDTEL